MPACQTDAASHVTADAICIVFLRGCARRHCGCTRRCTSTPTDRGRVTDQLSRVATAAWWQLISPRTCAPLNVQAIVFQGRRVGVVKTCLSHYAPECAR